MLWIDRPTINSDGAIVSTGLNALHVATLTSPTDRLQIIQIKGQFEIALVRF